MGNLKIKDIEGDPLDISKLFQEGGCDLPSYIGAKRRLKYVSINWIWIMTLSFFILASCVWIGLFSDAWNKVAILGVFLLCSLIVLLVHYNFKNISLTVITGFAGLIIILMSLNVYSPKEIAKKIENTTIKKYGEN